MSADHSCWGVGQNAMIPVFGLNRKIHGAAVRDVVIK